MRGDYRAAAGLAKIRDWLARIKRFWSERLDALERELRKPEKNGTGK